MSKHAEREQPILAMVMAMDRNRLIGKDGGLPWHIPGELAHFKAVTFGKPVIMGRRTHESIGRVLPGRANIVVTRDRDWQPAGASQQQGVVEAAAPVSDDGTSLEVAHSLADAIARGRVIAADLGRPEVMIIGGAAICREAMPDVERLYLTLVNHAFEGDTWLDAFDEKLWREISRRSPDPTDSGGYEVHYRVLERM